MIDWEFLHFIRPAWLAVLPLVFAAWLIARRWEGRRRGANTILAPHLEEALTVNRRSRRKIRPIDGFGISMLAATLAAAGPSWSKQPNPWFSETAALVIAMEVSDSMRSNDLQPTRLDRARFKVLDLIKLRTGSRTALIAYAGSAHIVIPPTTDIEVIKPFLESLDPAIMPEGGSDATSVLPLAAELLAGDAVTGTLLYVNDGFDPADIAELSEYSGREGAAAVVVLVVGTDEGGVALLPDGTAVTDSRGGRLDTAIDAALLSRVEDEASIPVIRATTSDSDIRQLLRRIESNLRLANDPNAQWLDRAWWFVWPAAFLSFLWFRRGWTMQW